MLPMTIPLLKLFGFCVFFFLLIPRIRLRLAFYHFHVLTPSSFGKF